MHACRLDRKIRNVGVLLSLQCTNSQDFSVSTSTQNPSGPLRASEAALLAAHGIQPQSLENRRRCNLLNINGNGSPETGVVCYARQDVPGRYSLASLAVGIATFSGIEVRTSNTR